MYTRLSLLAAFVVLLATHLYYPKWEKGGTEATLSWDVSGYYMYLPALFIYDDIKKCHFIEEIRAEYNFTPDVQQCFEHKESGNRVMKYSLGQAVQYAPFFFIAHQYAKHSNRYNADGFSRPYQVLISVGSLLIAFLGLLILSKILSFYFDDLSVGLTILIIVIGTNYLNYAAIDGAQTHNYLFTIYAALIYFSIRFLKSPRWIYALGIGVMVGLAALTRPTEILTALIPLLWGVHLFNSNSIRERISLFRSHLIKVLFAIAVCLYVGSLQLIYWKYVSGDWIVYSYEEYGFSWLNPHIHDGFLSYKSGWLVYTPVMFLLPFAFVALYKKHKDLVFPIGLYTLIFIYIAFSWDVWWYGGSLGQRTMVQVYPVLSFPIAALLSRSINYNRIIKTLLVAFIVFTSYFSLWFTHQAHRGGLLAAGQMTKAYFWKTLGKYEKKDEYYKLLDTDELIDGERSDVTLVYSDPSYKTILSKEQQFGETVNIQKVSDKKWIRATATFETSSKEWNTWMMTQFIVQFKNDDEVVKRRMIRIQRTLDQNQAKRMYIDVMIPEDPFDNVEIQFWNAGSQNPISISNLEIESFDEE